MSIDDLWFSWLKYQILNYYKDWLTTTEVRPGVFEKSETQKMFT